MNKECEQTRKALPDYLRGHVFRTTRNRIKRHLEKCAHCKSEFDTLRHVEETRRLLKDVDPPQGVGHRVKEGIFALTKLKKILYRPLWFGGIVLAVAGTYYYAMLPRQLDIEIEKIVKSAPVATFPVPPVLKKESLMTTMPAASAQRNVTQAPPAPVVQPLAVSITPDNETSAIQRINGIMGEHGQLKKMKFTETKRELSGKLTEAELLTLFDRLREVSRVRYDHKRFELFPAAQQIPFVLTLKAARTAAKPLQEKKLLHSAETYTPSAKEAPVQPAPPAHAQ